MNAEFWAGKKVAICGGASFIGSHVIRKLQDLDINYVHITDDFSSGNLENVPYRESNIHVDEIDLRNYKDALYATFDADIVLDLTSVHGGRGFVGTNHDVAISDNLIINTNVLKAAAENKVERYAFASSGCVYDTVVQMNEHTKTYIAEWWVTPDSYNLKSPDGMYGLTKLVHEKVIGAYQRDGLIDTAICRFFTVFGPRMKENHFILASIAKSFIKTDPFYVWGSPEIIRNFTPVQNTVQGFLLATERGGGEIYNIGMEQRITIGDALEKIWSLMNWRPKEVIYQPDKPVGIRNRVSDCTKAKKELGWEPIVTFEQGLRETIDWYIATHNVDDVRASLEEKMTGR